MIAFPLSGNNAVKFNFAPLATSIIQVVGSNAEKVDRIQSVLSSATGWLRQIDVRAFAYSFSPVRNPSMAVQHADQIAPISSVHPLLIRDLGWSEAKARDVYRQLQPFQEDWDAPGMEAYDAL